MSWRTAGRGTLGDRTKQFDKLWEEFLSKQGGRILPFDRISIEVIGIVLHSLYLSMQQLEDNLLYLLTPHFTYSIYCSAVQAAQAPNIIT